MLGQSCGCLGSMLAESIVVAAVHDVLLLRLEHMVTEVEGPIMGRESQGEGVKRPNRIGLYDLLMFIGENPNKNQGL